MVKRLFAVVVLGGLLACDGSTGVELRVLQIQGTVTSTADGTPIANVGVSLIYDVTGLGAFDRGSAAESVTDTTGQFALSVRDILCSPGAFDLGIVIPAGYGPPPATDTFDPIECVETLQVRNLRLAPTP